MLCQQSCFSSEDQDVIHPSNKAPSLLFFFFLPPPLPSSSFLLLFPFPLSGCCFSWISSLNHFDSQRISATYVKLMMLNCKAETWDSLRSGLQEPEPCGLDCLCSHCPSAIAWPDLLSGLSVAERQFCLEGLSLLPSPGKHPEVHHLGLEVLLTFLGEQQELKGERCGIKPEKLWNALTQKSICSSYPGFVWLFFQRKGKCWMV